jgi:hypothetical protein
LAGGFVQGDGLGTFATCEGDEVIAIDQWVGRIAPEGRLGLVDLFEVFRPNHFTGGSLEAYQIPFGS